MQCLHAQRLNLPPLPLGHPVSHHYHQNQIREPDWLQPSYLQF